MIIIDSFTGYSSLDCHSWLLRDCRSCIQALLTFRVSIEKTDVNLIAPPLCVSWVFSLQILLSFTYSIYQCFDYYVTQSISFLFWSICILYAFFSSIGISFSTLGKFSSMILRNVFSLSLTWVSSCSIPNIHRFGLFIVPQFIF